MKELPTEIDALTEARMETLRVRRDLIATQRALIDAEERCLKRDAAAVDAAARKKFKIAAGDGLDGRRIVRAEKSAP